MKLKEITFNRPVKVFQIFRNINVYGKKHKSFEDRKVQMSWTTISSQAGHLYGNDLYLPESILQDPDLINCDVITIEDDVNPQDFSIRDLKFKTVIASKAKLNCNHCFNLTRSNRIDIFEIRKEENIELFLNYGYFEVGTPKRNNFKLCDIKIGIPVEIKINGKTDHSLSSMRARIFKEQHYIFDFIGEFENCKIMTKPFSGFEKHIPSERKVIDLIKQLW